MRKLLSAILTGFVFGPFLLAQDVVNDNEYDNKYLEDQFFVGLGYNFILDKPTDVIQRNLSYNFQLGYIRDIPLNKKRNFGLGLGVGYATNSYYSNIIVEESNQGISYRLPFSDEGFDRSKIETHGIELPFEIRWRTSNPIDYKFWRVYAGIKAEYLFSRRSKLVGDVDTSFSNATVEQWQFGAMLNFGYNTWNLHLYWSLKQLLDENAILNNETINIRPLRIGVIFYIL